MERRKVQRLKRRLPCEFFHDGKRHRGILVDLSPTGLFLQAAASIDPGTEIELHLMDRSFPGILLRAQVTRRRAPPAILTSVIPPGLGLRIVEAPPAYYEALREEGADVPAGLGCVRTKAIRSETRGPEAPGEPEPEEAESPTEPGRPQAAPYEATEGDASAVAPEQVGSDEPAREAPSEKPDGWISEPQPSTGALLIDDGTLDDVYDLLAELGADPVRLLGAEAAGFLGWSVPPRLLVVSAPRAVRLRVPDGAAEDGVVSVAVAESDSRTLRRLLRSRGFQYVVRRPFHPEALRLLLLQGLYRSDERRLAVRLPFGRDVWWRTGLIRRPGLLTEISSEGCRILAANAPEPGTRLRIRIPREVAGRRALSLAGRVVRCERRVGWLEAETRFAFAIRFEKLGGRRQEHLSQILEALRIGPAQSIRAEQRLGATLQTARRRTQPRPEEAGEAAAAPGPERRRSPRAVLQQEVVALDTDAERVRQILLGCDLSLNGMRVQSHPGLALGDRIRLAFYGTSSLDPIVVDACVERVDAEGVALRFEEPSAELRFELEQLIAELPSLHGEGQGDEPKPLVVSEMLT